MDQPNYTSREAGEEDLFSIEDLFARRGIRRGWAAWKYLRNPDGAARVFIAEDPSKNIVGTLAYMPRRFSSDDGSSLTVMICADVFVNTELRDQGVFLRLLNFAGRHIDGAQIGVPNHNSAIFSSGSGWRALGPYYIWAFPILPGGRFSRKTLPFIAPIVNGLARIYQICWLSGDQRSVVMERLTRFRRTYALDRVVIHGVRSADYLNWRFMENPVSKYSAYEFLERGESVGYCVFTRVGSCAILADFVATRCRRSCLRVLVGYCRQNGISHLSYLGTGLQLGTLGFIPRGYESSCRGYQTLKGHWIVNSCDIDFEPHRTLEESVRSYKDGVCF